MNIHLLGTAAAEGYPAIFCNCAHCVQARSLGGPNIRSRSSAIIDDTLKIDFSGDTLYHVHRDKLDLTLLRDLLFTHTHMDHLAEMELTMRLPGFAHGCDHPLHIYGGDTALDKCRDAIQASQGRFEYHLIRPFRTFETTTGAKVTPLDADHDPFETCMMFYIEKNGKHLLYGHDSGWFPDSTWEWLKGKPIDVAIFDCTHGRLPGRRNHMNIDAVIETMQILRDGGGLSETCLSVATHFSHNTGMLHDDFVEAFAPSGIRVAYDGMVLEPGSDGAYRVRDDA